MARKPRYTQVPPRAPDPEGVWKKDYNTDVYRMKLGPLRLDVVHGHTDAPGKWIVRCEPLIYFKELDAATAEEAKDKALSLMREKIEHISNLLAAAG